jgi:hypothetical protein
MINIIEKIQASITGEAKWLRWVWRKCKRKAKRYKYTRQITNSPSNQAIGMANAKLPSQRSKTRRIEGFGEYVSQLPLCVNELHLYISLLNMVSQEVVSHFNVFGSPVENWVVG